MPIKDNIVYLDNTYLKAISTCSTKAFLLRILGLSSIDSNLDAAHVGSSFHAGVEAYCKTQGDREAAIQAFLDKYEELIPSEKDNWDSITLKRTRKPNDQFSTS